MKLINQLKKRKLWVLFGVLSFLSILYIISYTNTPPSNPTTQTPDQVEVIPPNLQLLSTYPAPGKYTLTFPQTALVFNFNQPVSQNLLKLVVTPSTEFKMFQSPDRMILYAKPLTKWKFNTEYHIVLVSPNGTNLVDQKTTFIDSLKDPSSSAGD